MEVLLTASHAHIPCMAATYLLGAAISLSPFIKQRAQSLYINQSGRTTASLMALHHED